MSNYRATRPRRDILEDLRQQGKFEEFLFIAWGIIELFSDETILKAYGLSSQDIRCDTLLDLSVGRKLKSLKEFGYISDEEYRTIYLFKEERNRLFHKGALSIHGLAPQSKEEIMDKGMHAVDVMHELHERTSSKPKPIWRKALDESRK